MRMPKSMPRRKYPWPYHGGCGPVFSTMLSARGAFLLNAAFVAGLLVLSQLPLLEQRLSCVPRSSASRWRCWHGSVAVRGAAARAEGAVEVALRRPHYVQARVHSTLLLTGATIWRGGHAAPLILAQFLLPTPLSLLSWTHRRKPALGFGPFPSSSASRCSFVCDPWFYWQFAMVATGLAAKEFVRDGVSTHIFNPSFRWPRRRGAAARRCERHDGA
jgi:hypothetical protein